MRKMKPALIIKGRRYYSPKLDEYVVAVKRGRVYSTFKRANDVRVRILPKNVWYVSVDDFNMCEELARATRMDSWFEGYFDENVGMEMNHEWREGRYHLTSYRHAIRDMYDGTDMDNLPIPKGYVHRFREIVKGMGYGI